MPPTLTTIPRTLTEQPERGLVTPGPAESADIVASTGPNDAEQPWQTTTGSAMSTETSLPAKTHADEDFGTDQTEFGKSSVFASSFVTATVAEIITESKNNSPPPPFTLAIDKFKLVLIIALSIIIGVFAITAVSLRIRSRIKKRRRESELLKKRRKSGPKPPVKRVTIKMGGDSSAEGGAKRVKRPLIRSHSPSLQSRAKIPQIPTEDGMDRNRTVDALLDAGVYPGMVLVSQGLSRDCTKSDVSSRTGLLTSSKAYSSQEHAYDNPVVSSVEEIRTEMTVLSDEACSVDRTINKTGVLTPGYESENESLEKMNCIESSETESLGDARKRLRLNHYFGMRSSQRNDSKDSGYVESFVSQDSLRLRAMASLEEGRAIGDGYGFCGGHDKALSRPPNMDPTLFMASVDETSTVTPDLYRSSSVKSDDFAKSWQDANKMSIRRSRFSAPSFPSQYPQCFPHHRRHVNRSPYHELYSAPKVPYYQANNLQRYPSSENCLAYDYEPMSVQNQRREGNQRQNGRVNSHMLPKSHSYESTLYRSRDYGSPYHDPASYDAILHQKRTKRFVKHRSLGTQTCDDAADASVVRSIVQWDYDVTGSLVAKPQPNTELDFIGPIYMAEELENISGDLYNENGIGTSSV